MDKKTDRFKETADNTKIILFAALMISFFIIGLAFFARPSESENEKRKLTEFPEFSLSSFLSGEFTNQVSLWYADTYPLREGMIQANGGFQSLYGIRGEQIIIGGNADKIPDQPSDSTDSDVIFNPTDDGAGEKIQGLYVNGDTAYQLYTFNRQNSDSYAALINKLAADLKGKAQVYDMIVPLHYQIAISADTAERFGASDCQAAIEYIYKKLDNSIVTVDTLPYLIKHNNEYLYFRTDHHWTARGAYYAFTAFCDTKGITATPLSSYEALKFDGFLGTLYAESNQPSAMKSNPDFLEAFVPRGTNKITVTDRNGNVTNYSIVNTKTDAWYPAAGAKYNCFIAGDNPISEIHNPDITDGSAIVIIKESYGNAFVPFLVDSYEYVYVIDYRYWSGDLADFVIDNSIGDVLFLNVVNVTSTSARLNEMADIIK